MTGPIPASVGILHQLQPFTGFNTLYQGTTALNWLMVTEGGKPLDDNAGKPGYSPNLVRGLPVPMGARLTIWFPHVYVQTTPLQTYRWVVLYRLRNLAEFRTNRGSYHLQQSSPGVANGGSARVLKPAAYRGFAYQEAEPADPPQQTYQSRGTFNVHPFDYRIYSGRTELGAPLVPNTGSGTQGEIQQGVLDPAVFGVEQALCPSWDVVQETALGDELLIGVYRDTDLAATWNFNVGGADAHLSAYLTGQAGGVYVFSGSGTPGNQSVP